MSIAPNPVAPFPDPVTDDPVTDNPAAPPTSPDQAGPAEVNTNQPTPPRRTNRTTNWGVFAYIALALLTIAVAWGLVLTTTLVNRSGRTTNDLVHLLTTSQQGRQNTIDELQQQLDQTRTTTQTELSKARQQTGKTTSTVAELSENNAKAWQDIARTSNDNLATASQQRIALAESLLQQSEARQQAAAAAAQTAVERAQARETAATATLTRYQNQTAKDLRALQAHSRQAIQIAINTGRQQLDRAQQHHDHLDQLPRTPDLTTTLQAAAAHLTTARQHLRHATTTLTENNLDTDKITTISDHLNKASQEITQAEQALEKAEDRLHLKTTETETDERAVIAPPSTSAPRQPRR